MNSKPLNPHAPEFRPSAALLQPYHRSFAIPPLPRSPVAAVKPPPPPPPPPLPPPLPSQQHLVGASSRPRRFRNIHDRREDGGFMMRRGVSFSNKNNFSYRSKRRSGDINHSKDDVRQRMASSLISKAPNYSYVEKVRSPAVPVSPGGHETTVMIRNIPNEFTRRRLIQFLDDFCSRVNSNKNKLDDDACGGDEESKPSQEEAVAFDFVYLPMDFRTKLNKGYAFVNLTTPKGVWRMEEENLKNQTWGYGDSVRKRREIAVAKIQMIIVNICLES
ncbi:hypothetical protein V2J09_016805 [Rumex salicifolius]